MAVVITTDEASAYFSSPGALRRSHSQSHFASSASSASPFAAASSSCTNLQSLYHQSTTSSSGSSTTTTTTTTARPSSSPYSHTFEAASSTADSSPRLATASSNPSVASTPSSNFSLLYDDDDDDQDDYGYHNDSSSTSTGGGLITMAAGKQQLHPPASSPAAGSSTPDDYDVSQVEQVDDVTEHDTPKPDTPEVHEHAEDDSAVSTRPSRQVDYLSHEWREEDIWSSWRYIVNKRGEFANSARLENASWRTWMKSKNKLSTVSPETLNWLKDCDVTWLYGPLQPGPNGQSPARSGTGSSALLSKSGSSSNLAHKKPILKKRSTSEVMLQRSLSTASLLKQAAAAVQAQESTRGILRPAFVRASTDYAAYPFTTGGRRLSGGNLAVPSSFYTSTAASSLASPSVERKHIHFNEQVEQCIAVDVKGDDDDDDEGRGRAVFDDSDGDSSDDGIVMKRSRSRKKAPVLNRGGGGGGRRRHRHRTTTSSSSSSTASLREMGANSGSNTAAKTTIAMLPSTTLKYREDTPERSETAMKHSTGRSPLGSPTSSQETLRPSRSRGRFMLGDEDEDDGSDSKDEEAMAVDGFCNPDGDDAGHDDAWLRQHSGADDDGSSGSGSGIASPPSDDGKGLQRTASGMLMPYDEAEARRDGMFGRVVDTVNTARDIAHVIWNVGWRK